MSGTLNVLYPSGPNYYTIDFKNNSVACMTVIHSVGDSWCVFVEGVRVCVLRLRALVCCGYVFRDAQHTKLCNVISVISSTNKTMSCNFLPEWCMICVVRSLQKTREADWVCATEDMMELVGSTRLVLD